MKKLENDFDALALFESLDRKRLDENLTWTGVARSIWKITEPLNQKRNDHPISPATLTGMQKRADTSCQHALFMLRWLGRAPEDFIADPQPGTRAPLPKTDSEHRLRWNLRRLYAVLDRARAKREATWREAANYLHCTPNQLTGLRTAKFATSMRLAMRICQSLRKPAADFVEPASW